MSSHTLSTHIIQTPIQLILLPKSINTILYILLAIQCSNLHIKIEQISRVHTRFHPTLIKLQFNLYNQQNI